MKFKEALLAAEQGITKEKEISPRTTQQRISEYLEEKSGELSLHGMEGIKILGYNVDENILIVDVKAHEITRTDRSNEGFSRDLQKLIAENGIPVNITLN